MFRCWRPMLLVLVALGMQNILQAQGPEDVPGGTAPLLRLAPHGPLSQISSVAFSPNGQTLYAGGWDKVVHVWTRQPSGFVYDRDAVYHIPIGGGLDGGINALAISADGQWLAVGGRGAKRGVAGQRESGNLIPGAALSPEAWMDEGQIYVFNTGDRTVRILRGHRGAIVSLAFVTGAAELDPLLVSLGATSSNGREGAQCAVWNIRTGTLVGSTEQYRERQQILPLPPVNVSFPPQPVAWRTGPSELDVKVALTWGTPDFGVRFWNLGETTVGPAQANDSHHYFSLGELEEGRFYCGAGNTRTGQMELGEWFVGNARGRPSYTLIKSFGRQELVTNIAPAAGGTGPAVVIADTQHQQARLVVLDAFGKNVVTDQSLWPGLFVATLARAREEGSLAVCHAGSAEILVFDAGDLQRGQPPQRLKLDLPSLESVAFVSNGERAGLNLEHSGGQNAIFDLARSQWIAQDGRWTNHSHDARGWNISSASPAAGSLVVTVQSPDQETFSVDVRSRVAKTAEPVLTTAAVFAGNNDLKAHWLICGLQTNFQPELQVYDLLTGEQIRQFTGHTGAIRQVVVSENGHLAASISDDHTLRVWRLSDIPEELGRHALVRDGNELLEVELGSDHRVTAANAVAGFQPGTQILGAVTSQEELPLRDAFDFYEVVYMRSPGESLTFKTNQGDIPVVLGQAIDDCKDLFSLFVIPAERPADWQWIGWSPLGPYEASQRDAERLLGWHFNTADPADPARFSAAEGYREAYETPQLLYDLYRLETLPERRAAPPPTLSVSIQNDQGEPLAIDFDSSIPVNDLQSVARLQVSGQRLSQLIAAVDWILEGNGDEQQTLPARSSGPVEWQAKLSDFQWKRGRYRLRARVTSREFPPRQFEESVPVRFQPAPPAVTLETPEAPATVAAMDFKFRVRPSQVPAEVTLLQRTSQGSVAAEHHWSQPVSSETTLSHSLQLQPGLNQIEVIASNVQPLPGFELAETTRVVATIPFVDSMPEELPRLTHCEIQSGKNAAVTVAAGNILEVDSATVTLSGIVHCPNPVQALRVLLPERDAKVVPLTGRTGDVPFSLPLALQAGHQNVQILIDAAAQERAQFAVRLIYRPQLPLLANLRALPVPIPNAGGEQRPSADAELLLTAGQHEPAIQLTAEVQLADEAPFDAAILVDGQELPNLTVQRKGTQLTAQVPIHPGRQRIQLRLKNAWQRESYSREIPVFFRRLPRIVSVAEPPVSVNSPRVNQIELMVSSPPELPPLADKIHVFVNQSPLPCNADVNHLENDNWQVTLRGVVLDREGENTVRMVVANRDGECLTPAVQKWVLMTPPQSKADIIVRGPESQTRDREVQLQFAVHSESPLQTVLIERVTGTEKFQPLARMASETEPGLEPELVKDGSLLFRLPLELSPGVNDLQVTAVNDGGSRTIRYRISCTPLPVRLQIERLGQIQPERKNEFLNFGGPVSGSNAELTGFIEWDQSETPPNYVQFWVNGFMQQSADLVSRPGFQNRKYFHVTLTFSRERQNSVEVTLPGYAADAASQKHMSFVVDCEQPRGGQDLYLVIIGTLPPSQAPTNYRQILEKRAEQALQARLGPDQRLQSSAFSEIHSTTLTGRDATYTRINSALAMLRYRMRPPARREAASTENSVLMIYYHGREMLVQQPGATTFVLATTDTWENPAAHLNKSLKNTDLAESLSQYYGAHVLFLDVESVNMPQDAHWPDDPHLGIIRTVWSDDRWNPETPELMSAMASTLPSVRKLGELASQMELIWEQAGPLVSDFKIPLSLKQLEVRGISLD